MELRTIRFIFYISIITAFNLNAQITATEKILTTHKKDSLEGWNKGGVIGLNFSQTSLSNWAAGGQSSISLGGITSLYANRTKGETLWENSLNIGYGIIQQGKNGPWWKTDDEIDFTIKYGRKAFRNWFYAGLLSFKTQMDEGYNYPDDSTRISNLLAPGYLLIAIGLNYKPNDAFGLFLAPITAKNTFVIDQDLADAGAFGVEPASYDKSTGAKTSNGATTRIEIGGYIRAFYKHDLMENVAFQTKLGLFSNYSEKPENIDVSWEVLLVMKVNDYITVNFTTHLLYDHDIQIGVDNNGNGIIDGFGPRTQFKEVLAVGFSYKF